METISVFLSLFLSGGAILTFISGALLLTFIFCFLLILLEFVWTLKEYN